MLRIRLFDHWGEEMARGQLTLGLVVAWLAARSAGAQPLAEWHLDDPAWLKTVAGRVAKCVGIMRGGAYVLRRGGQERSAAPFESSAREYFVTAQTLLTSRAAKLGQVLFGEGAEAYVKGLAYGEESRYKAMAETDLNGDEQSAMLRGCVEINEVVATMVTTIKKTVSGID
jgi:hypothetical protein